MTTQEKRKYSYRAREIVKGIKQAITEGMHLGRKLIDPNIIHASSLYNFCVYRFKLARENGIHYEPEMPIDLGRAITFKIGSKIQDIIVESVRESYPRNTLIKRVCAKCNKTYIGTMYNAEEICSFCDKMLKDYEISVEYKVPESPFRIIGNIDLLFGYDKYYIIEIKSVRPEDFSDKTPIFRYQYQVGVYLWLLKNNKQFCKKYNIDPKMGMLLYVSKKHASNPLKCFVITTDKVENVWKDIDSIVDKLKTFSKTGKAHKECTSSHHILARQCPFKEQCWR